MRTFCTLEHAAQTVKRFCKDKKSRKMFKIERNTYTPKGGYVIRNEYTHTYL